MSNGDDNGPPDPSAALDGSAVIHHEIHQSLRRAGFGRWQALWLTACTIKGVPLPAWFAEQLNATQPPPDGPE